MRRLSFKLPALRLAVAAACLALGLASIKLWARRPAPQPPPPAAAASAQPKEGVCAPSEDESGDDNARVEDRYYNYEYGFSVDLPGGMVGVMSPPPMPQHGFGVDLDNPRSIAWTKSSGFPRSYIDVDASYNSAFIESLDAAVKRNLDSLAERNGEVRVLKRTPTRLAGLRAARVVTRYKENGVMMLNDEVVAFRAWGDEDKAVVYTIDLYTPQSNYERDRPVLEEMQKTWCLQPLP